MKTHQKAEVVSQRWRKFLKSGNLAAEESHIAQKDSTYQASDFEPNGLQVTQTRIFSAPPPNLISNGHNKWEVIYICIHLLPYFFIYSFLHIHTGTGKSQEKNRITRTEQDSTKNFDKNTFVKLLHCKPKHFVVLTGGGFYSKPL